MKFVLLTSISELRKVTPLVGVWIEISAVYPACSKLPSLPLWECGLKFVCVDARVGKLLVTPLVGVWIEIDKSGILSLTSVGHSPCGSVD